MAVVSVLLGRRAGLLGAGWVCRVQVRAHAMATRKIKDGNREGPLAGGAAAAVLFPKARIITSLSPNLLALWPARALKPGITGVIIQKSISRGVHEIPSLVGFQVAMQAAGLVSRQGRPGQGRAGAAGPRVRAQVQRREWISQPCSRDSPACSSLQLPGHAAWQQQSSTR